MSKVLVVKSFVFGEEPSNTAKVLNAFLNEYKEVNPNDEIDVIDTFELNMQALNAAELKDIFEGKEVEATKYAKALTEYDKIVMAAPLWNLSIPASLKCYIDYVTYAGITFKYTENGPVGLLNSPKFVYLTSRGGIYKDTPMAEIETGAKYVETIFAFMGAEVTPTVAFEGTNMLQGEALDQAREAALAEAREVAKKF